MISASLARFAALNYPKYVDVNMFVMLYGELRRNRSPCAPNTSVSVVLDRHGHLFPQHDDALLQALEYSPQ